MESHPTIPADSRMAEVMIPSLMEQIAGPARRRASSADCDKAPPSDGFRGARRIWQGQPKAGAARLTIVPSLLMACSLVVVTAARVPAASARIAQSFDAAQQSQPQEVPAPPPDETHLKSGTQAVNPDDLGVSIDRIRLRFTRNSVFDNVFDPRKLKMTAYVDVVGKAPEIKLFGFDVKTVKEELTSQAVPYGAPTHGEIVRMLTPQEFRTPPMDLTAIIRWLAQELDKKEEK